MQPPHEPDLDSAAAPASHEGVQRGRFFSAVTAFAGRPIGKVSVLSVWLVLVLSGLLVLKSFMAALISDVPPVEGSQSYEAAEAVSYYFPEKAISSAFLCRSAARQPFVDFIERSTCKLQHSPVPGQLGVRFFCENRSALGGGCIRKDDLTTELTSGVEATLSGLLKNATLVQEMMQIFSSRVLPELNDKLPNTTLCPVTSNAELTKDWLNFSAEISSSLQAQFPMCMHKIQSFATVPDETVNRSMVLPYQGMNLTIDFEAELAAGSFWSLFQSQLLADAGATSLLAATTVSCDGKAVPPGSEQAKQIADAVQQLAAGAPSTMSSQVTSQTLMMNSIQAGIKQTMDLSTMTMPFALLTLAAMAGNLRLVICTVVNLLASLVAAILCMYPVALHVEVSTTAPSLMVAVALGMSIDYSLFMLTRFQKEVKDGHSAHRSVEAMMQTSGKIVLVSGLTLFVCFLMMLSLPVHFIAFMGVSAAITVFMAVLAALTLTPVMLLTFPDFFGSDRRWGLSCDGCCRRRVEDSVSSQFVRQISLSHTEALDLRMEKSCWPTFGGQVQRFGIVVLVLLAAVAIPLAAVSLPRFSHSAGLVPFMPSDSPATHTIIALQEAFGVGALFPTSLLLVPPPGATASEEGRTSWLAESCAALQSIAEEMETEPGVPRFTASSFIGPMILNGKCTTVGLGQWSNVSGPYSATQVLINYQIDPFSTEGGRWITQLREAVSHHSEVATWYVSGAGPNQMDAANITFAKFPIMILLMMVVVLLLIGVAFRSVVAPIRAVFCLLWMLAITFSLSIFVFQDGAFSFLHWSQLGRRSSGAMSWMSPCISCSVIIGLGLDYDIFYSESIVEERALGHGEKEAAVRALTDTANTISAAGAIMVIAFASLLLSTTPTLNEIAFMLIVGVLIDCFITTKIIMPAAMALLGKFNFWPRHFPAHHQQDCRSTAGVSLSSAAGSVNVM